MISFSKPTLDEEEELAVFDVMRSGWLAAGPKTKEFEEQFAKYVGVKYAIFTNSGTSALKMAYKYFVKEEATPRFIGPANTFSATYSALEETKGNTEYFKEWPPKKVPYGYGVVSVHYGGVKDTTPCLLEDSAHRIEENDPLIGKIRIYSFYVTKNMTTGSGGMLVTDNKDIYEACRLYWKDGIDKSSYDRQHGDWNYQVKVMAGGYDGNDIAAAIGLEQLKKLPEFTEKRNRRRDLYNESFGQTWEGNHLYPYFVEKESDIGRLINHLKENNIQASYHYPGTGWLGVSLPIYPLLTKEEVEYIIKVVKEFK